MLKLLPRLKNPSPPKSRAAGRKRGGSVRAGHLALPKRPHFSLTPSRASQSAGRQLEQPGTAALPIFNCMVPAKDWRMTNDEWQIAGAGLQERINTKDGLRIN
jgi:hypothetical protein